MGSSFKEGEVMEEKKQEVIRDRITGKPWIQYKPSGSSSFYFCHGYSALGPIEEKLIHKPNCENYGGAR